MQIFIWYWLARCAFWGTLICTNFRAPEAPVAVVQLTGFPTPEKGRRMLASMSRWVREGPGARVLPIRLRHPLERLTAARAYPARTPLRWTQGGNREATLLLGGDLALHRVDPGGDPARIFAGLAALASSADAFVVNLETQLTSLDAPGAGIGSSIRADPRAMDVLRYLGVRAVTCANNHALDFGPVALAESARRVEEGGIAVAGVQGDGSDGSAIVEVRGIRVGLLAFTDDWRAAELTGTARPAGHEPAAVRTAIAALRARADLVVVQLHWGYEWSMYPMRTHRDLARSYVSGGADLVVCHHAHVPMGVETWQRGAIAHGLGNLYFGRSTSRHHPFVNRSFVLRAGISLTGVTDLEVVPVATFPDGTVGPLSGGGAGEMAAAIGYLSGRLNQDEYLSQVEQSLLCRQGSRLLLDLARRRAAGDAQGLRERVRFLATPRQRFLAAWLSAESGALSSVGTFLEDLREGRKDLGRPAAVRELESLRPTALRVAERWLQKGRIP